MHVSPFYAHFKNIYYNVEYRKNKLVRVRKEEQKMKYLITKKFEESYMIETDTPESAKKILAEQGGLLIREASPDDKIEELNEKNYFAMLRKRFTYLLAKNRMIMDPETKQLVNDCAFEMQVIVDKLCDIVKTESPTLKPTTGPTGF